MDEAHSRAFAVAGATEKSLIQDFRDAVDKAISQGTSFAEFRKDFDSIVKQHGWSHTGTADWRAKVIYQTNLRTAFAAGRYAQMTQPAVLAAFPYWEYLHVNCPNPRPQHVAWSGMVLRADDPFWSSCYPPNGWGCHCIVASVNDRGLARMGKAGPDTTPDLQWREYVNQKTGIVTRVPAGVDPGFVGNPGKAWAEHKQTLKTPAMKALGPAPPVLASPGMKAVPSAVLRQFIEKPEGEIQVGTLPASLVETMKAKQPAVLLSANTMTKQLANHADLSLRDYAALEFLLNEPSAVLENRPMHLRLVSDEIPGTRALTAVIKRTRAGDRWYLQSFHFADAKAIEQFQRKFKLVSGSVTQMLDRLRKRVR
jgi:hypothetical protein